MSKYNLIYSDINESLIDYIDPRLIGRDTAFFYVERRHWLEIVPEALVSLSLVITLLAILANWNPVMMCRDDTCQVLAAALVLVSFIGVILFPFGIEVWRWQRQIHYLTNNGWSEYLFTIYPFHRFGFHNHQLGFLSSTDAAPSQFYRWLGLDVGYMMARSVDESRRFTPLIPRPFALKTRFDEAKNYKPAPPKPEEKLWTQ